MQIKWNKNEINFLKNTDYFFLTKRGYHWNLILLPIGTIIIKIV